jgi:diguanylate cyclase (GGDEF)-like protein
MGLKLYAALEKAPFLRSYLWKLHFASVVLVQLPLLGMLSMVTGFAASVDRTVLPWLALGALAQFVALLVCFHWLFQPIRIASEALRTYLRTGEVPAIPTRYRDEAGILLRMVDRTLRSFQRERASLEVQAAEDPLTGLLNRRAVAERLAALGALDVDGQGATVALLDLDHFKRINDEFGHAAGDAALVQVAAYLRKGLRQEDLVCRWGGEEFLVYLRCPEYAGETLERLRRGIESLPFAFDGRPVPLTVSIGCADLLAGEDPAGAIRRADEALYEAKRAGRNRIVSS